MEFARKQLEFDVLGELKCPVCDEYMEPPITLCENGHNICKTCKPNLQSCPSCRGNFLTARNVALENIARFTVYPCKNRDEGCMEIMPIDKIRSHLLECFFENRKCPYTELSNVKCPWNGFLSDMKEHVLNDHGFETDTRQESGPFTVSLKDIGTSKCYIAAVVKLEELFFALCKIIDNNFFCAVINVGTKNEASNYKYRFTIASASGMEIVSACFVAQSILNDIENVLQPGECVTLHYGTVAKFVDARNNLTCEMEIYKVDSGAIQILRRCDVPDAKLLSLVPRSYTNSKIDHQSEDEENE